MSITAAEIEILLHIIQKPYSIIILLLIQNICKFLATLAPVIFQLLNHWTQFQIFLKISTRMGFEPTRAEHIGLAVQRLNHSATSS